MHFKHSFVCIFHNETVQTNRKTWFLNRSNKAEIMSKGEKDIMGGLAFVKREKNEDESQNVDNCLS